MQCGDRFDDDLYKNIVRDTTYVTACNSYEWVISAAETKKYITDTIDSVVIIDTYLGDSIAYLNLTVNNPFQADLEIVSKIMFPKPYCIVCTSDGFVGKEWLMRQIGCIPTQKFVSDVTLIGDINYALHKENVSVLMYPEASYSFDGCATPLPRRLGILLKKLRVPGCYCDGPSDRPPELCAPAARYSRE